MLLNSFQPNILVHILTKKYNHFMSELPFTATTTPPAPVRRRRPKRFPLYSESAADFFVYPDIPALASDISASDSVLIGSPVASARSWISHTYSR